MRTIDEQNRFFMHLIYLQFLSVLKRFKCTYIYILNMYVFVRLRAGTLIHQTAVVIIIFFRLTAACA